MEPSKLDNKEASNNRGRIWRKNPAEVAFKLRCQYGTSRAGCWI